MDRSDRRLLVLSLCILLVLACGPGSVLGAIPGMKPTPSLSNLSTGSSPLSGDWNAATQFGRFAFTVDPTGQTVETTVVKISSFHCGGTFLTTETQLLNTYPLTDGRFNVRIDLGESNETLYIQLEGAYHPATKSFSGSWDFDASGAHCTGDWTSLPHK